MAAGNTIAAETVDLGFRTDAALRPGESGVDTGEIVGAARRGRVVLRPQSRSTGEIRAFAAPCQNGLAWPVPGAAGPGDLTHRGLMIIDRRVVVDCGALVPARTSEFGPRDLNTDGDQERYRAASNF